MTSAYCSRSPHAHAAIRAIDTAAAEAMPGVLGVWIGADLAAAKVGGLPCGWIVRTGGDPMAQPPHPVLARGRVRHVGDPVAFVVAETRAQALDAAEAIAVDYEILPHVVELDRAVDPAAPQLWDEAPGNRCYEWSVGDAAAVDRAFAGAAHVAKLKLVNNRVHASPMETRGAIGQYDPSTDRHTLYTSNQNPHIIRILLSLATLGISEEKLRVVAPDVGGGFGMKIYHYAEEVLVLFASAPPTSPGQVDLRPHRGLSQRHACARPRHRGGGGARRRWRGAGAQGRHHRQHGRVPLDLRAGHPVLLLRLSDAGPYKVRAVHCRVRAAFTNTQPVDAYRGAGRPEATYVLERIMDEAARTTGIDRVEIRRRNLIPAEAFPYKTPLLWTYDVGDLADAPRPRRRDGRFRRPRRAASSESAARGRLRGLGFAFYMEACGMGPSKMLAEQGCGAGQFEVGQVRVNPTGTVTVLTGSHSHGQGHETVFAQLVADSLGVAMDRVEVVHGDTDRVPYGVGTYGSRSLAVGGSALKLSLDKVVEKGRKIAAHAMEADPRDVVFEAGTYRVAGTDLRRSFRRSRLPPTTRSTTRSTGSSRGSRRPPGSTRPTSPFPMAATSARSRSTRIPAARASSGSWRSTISATRSTRWWSRARSMAGSPRASARP